MIGALALVLAVVALDRSAPTFSVEPVPGARYAVWHQGPGSVVVRRAFVLDASGAQHAINSANSGVEMTDVDGGHFPPTDAPFGERVEVPPHRRDHIFVDVLRSVAIEYRAKGILGHLSRATVRIDEGP